MRFWIVLLLVISLTACASGRSEGWYSLVDWTGLVDWEKTERSNQWAIDDDALLYVAMPTQELLKDSFHAKLTTTFQRYYPKTRAAIHRESLRQSFVSAQYAGMDYLIYPHIRNIEDIRHYISH